MWDRLVLVALLLSLRRHFCPPSLSVYFPARRVGIRLNGLPQILAISIRTTHVRNPYSEILCYTRPKYFSKKAMSLAITFCFLAMRSPPPKRETGGKILSTSVPVVWALRHGMIQQWTLGFLFLELFVTDDFGEIILLLLHNKPAPLVIHLGCVIDSGQEAFNELFLLRSSILELTALSMVVRMVLSSQLESRYLATNIRM